MCVLGVCVLGTKSVGPPQLPCPAPAHTKRNRSKMDYATCTLVTLIIPIMHLHQKGPSSTAGGCVLSLFLRVSEQVGG